MFHGVVAGTAMLSAEVPKGTAGPESAAPAVADLPACREGAEDSAVVVEAVPVVVVADKQPRPRNYPWRSVKMKSASAKNRFVGIFPMLCAAVLASLGAVGLSIAQPVPRPPAAPPRTTALSAELF